jgi:hypothetical protein
MLSLLVPLWLPILSLATGLSCANAGSAPLAALQSQEGGYRVELRCENGLPVERNTYFLDTGRVSQRLLYKNGKAVESRIYSNEGEWTGLFTYEDSGNGRVVRTSYAVEKGAAGDIKSKEELTGFDPESNEVQLQARARRRWFYRDDGKTVDFIAHYPANDADKIVMKDYPNAQGKILSRIYFYYRPHEEKPFRFVEKAPNGKILTQRTLYEPFNPEESLRSAGLPAAEIQRRLRHQKNPDRFLLAIIDGGFDYNHPELSWKWWNNPTDPVDGKDNDGNGWRDDQFGWEREKGSPLPAETSTSMTAFSRPDSHGTHVAHIATRGLEGLALIGFAGDYTRAAYIDQISAFLKAHKVKVVNLSIGLPKDMKDDFGLRDGIRAHERMIRGNPETLFVVAAGNESKDIDLYANHQYPASFNFPNVLKVGSLDTNHIEKGKYGSYRMSPWSNTGKESVDILAPGKDISAARFGGGYVVHSGTSMASPYMAHEAVRLWMEFPALKASQVKEIFVRSAHRMSPAPNIASGGFVDFEAAEKTAREILR